LLGMLAIAVLCSALILRGGGQCADLSLTRPHGHTMRMSPVTCSKKSRKRKKLGLRQGLGEMGADRLQVECNQKGCRIVDAQGVEVDPALSEAEAPVDLLRNCEINADTGNILLTTPKVYEELLSTAPDNAVSIVRYGAPWCRSCRTIGPDLQEFAATRWPAATFYQIELVRNGKAVRQPVSTTLSENELHLHLSIAVPLLTFSSACFACYPDACRRTHVCSRHVVLAGGRAHVSALQGAWCEDDANVRGLCRP
jgi:thiol-disulfide isomerase/thioredoxin